jgi:hypothetical protein
MADMKDAVGASARMFWIYQAFALAASLLAFLPDRSSIYTEAIGELRGLISIHISVGDVDATLVSPADKAIGNKVFAAIGSAAKANGLSLSKALKANFSYTLVERGPQSLDFDDTKVGDMLDALDAYATDPHYVVSVPQPDALKNELSSKFAGIQGAIMSASIPCNYAPDRCQGEVYVNPNGDVATGAQRVIQFSVPRLQKELDFGTRDLVAARYPALGSSWLAAPALRQVRDDIAELTPTAAIAKLQEMRKGEGRPITIFDVSLSGSVARLVAPVVLALLALAAWASASGLKVAGQASGTQDSMFLPLIKTTPAAIVRCGTYWFPLFVAEGLLLRAGSVGILGWVAALVSLGIQAWAVLAMFAIFDDLRAPRAPRLVGWRARGLPAILVATILLAAGWSAAITFLHRSASPITTPSPAPRAVRDEPHGNAPAGSRPVPEAPSADERSNDAGGLPASLPLKVRADEKREEDAVARIRRMEGDMSDGPN